MATVSVIIPTHNPTSYISEAIKSVTAQTHPPDEILLIDDGSTSEHQAFINKLCQQTPKLRLVRLKGAKGVSRARNIGIIEAKGDFLLFLDDDDRLAPHMIENGLKEFGVHADADVIMSKGIAFTADTESGSYRKQKSVFDYNQRKYGNRSFEDLSYFLIYSPMIHGLLFRRRVFDYAMFCKDLKYGEDRYLWMELRSKGVQFAGVDWVGGFYRLGGLAAAYKVPEQQYFFKKLIKSGMLSSRFEFGYARSLLFLLSLKGDSIAEITKCGLKAAFYPKILLSQIWKFVRLRIFYF